MTYPNPPFPAQYNCAPAKRVRPGPVLPLSFLLLSEWICSLSWSVHHNIVWVLRHNDGFCNTCTLKRCLHRTVDFKTNATNNVIVSQLFPLQSRVVTKGLYYISYFQIKTNSLKLDAVIKKYLVNCSLLWTDSLWEQSHLKTQLFTFASIKWWKRWVTCSVEQYTGIWCTVSECRPCRIHRFVAAPLYVMVDIVKGGGRATPTITRRGNFSIMMECTPESGNCNSLCTVWPPQPGRASNSAPFF